jgi:hypothetical protein
MKPDDRTTPGEDQVAFEVTRRHLQHFTDSDPRCRGLQLPEGLMLRYTLSRALYFYLRTGVRDGKISTRIFASDSPYDPQKTAIGEVLTPMFEPRADSTHLKKVERLLRAWVEFVKEAPDDEVAFKSFEVDDRRGE